MSGLAQRLVFSGVLLLLVLCGPFSAVAQSEKYALPLYYTGRVLVEEHDAHTSYIYSWPGVYFEAEFIGSEVEIRLNDSSNILNIIIDDNEPIVLTKPGKITHSVKSLGKGKHKVRLEKRTETQMDTGTFNGFYVSDKSSVLTELPRQRRMEFIGDSFTVGYGNLSPGRECSNDEIFRFTNTQQAFGALTAKHFNADYQINAISGSGVVRNYNGAFPEQSFLTSYPYTLRNNNTIVYADDSWSPHIIVAELGGNDFSTPLNAGERWKNREALQADYVKKYTAFLHELRSRNPQANFILLVPKMPSQELYQQHNKIVEQLKAEGESRIHLLSAEAMELSSCQWHPSLKDHQAVSQLLIDFINANPQFWKSKKS